MSLKNIISKFSHQEKEEPKVFLAIEISSETVKSALWTVKLGKTEIIKIGSLQEWDGKNQELLLSAVDKSISNACEKIETEPEGIIFGLPKNWVSEDQITKEKKELLKFICEKLELKPLGFVVSLEALVTYLKTLEGTPVNAILIQIQEAQSLISLVQMGKVKGTHAVGHSEDLAADVREGLARFKKIENFPARMIIFNGTIDLEEYKQQLVSFDWLEKLPFLHFPKVESLEANQSIKAVAIAGGSEVAKSLGFAIKKAEEEKAREKEMKDEEVKPAYRQAGNTEEEKPSETPEKTEAVSAASLGFIQDQDITQVEQPESASRRSGEEKEIEVKREERKPESTLEEKPTLKPRIPFQPLGIISKLTTMIKKLFFNLRLLFLGGKKRFVLIIIILALLLSAGGVFAFFWYVPKAKITLYLTPKTLEKELSITLDTSINQIDKENGIIPGNQETVTVEGNKKIETTGEKIVGDKAKGEVVIYNKTDVAKTFTQGAVLIGSDDLKFILDEEVSVASKSSEPGDEGEQIIYGKTTAAITAAAIGTESNLGGESTFSFSDYAESQFSAKTEGGLSGGTSRQIKVVDEEDVSSLLNKLTEELEEEAIEKLKTEVSSEKEIVDKDLESEVVSQNFSAEAGDETDQLELDLKIKFTAFSYRKKDLEELLADSIKDELSEDYIFDPEKTEIVIDEIEVEEDKIELKTKMKAYLLPKIDFTEIKKNLLGRQPEKTKEYLEELPNFSSADIEIKPNLPGILKTLPRSSQNIIIETEIEGDD